MGDLDELSEAVQTFLRNSREEQVAFDRLLATVLFTDIVDSTSQTAAMGDQAWRKVQEAHDTIVRAQLTRYRGREIRTMGDGFLATFDGPGRAVRCAQAISAAMRPLGIEIRAGLHTGEIELNGSEVGGIAVAIGARVGALAGPSEVLVSNTVKDLVAGSGLTFEDRGIGTCKGPRTPRWHQGRSEVAFRDEREIEPVGRPDPCRSDILANRAMSRTSWQEPRARTGR
jgi:class 3 adenylate cyclase